MPKRPVIRRKTPRPQPVDEVVSSFVEGGNESSEQLTNGTIESSNNEIIKPLINESSEQLTNETMKKSAPVGRPKGPKKKQICVMMTLPNRKALRLASVDEDRSQGEILEEALDEWLKRRGYR